MLSLKQSARARLFFSQTVRSIYLLALLRPFLQTVRSKYMTCDKAAIIIFFFYF